MLQILYGYVSVGSKQFSTIHLVSIFKRICKLLSFRIRPVFVFGNLSNIFFFTKILYKNTKINYPLRLKYKIILIIICLIFLMFFNFFIDNK